MKYLTKFCTGALAFGALMMAGSSVASANHIHYGYRNHRSPIIRPQFQQVHYVTPAVVANYRVINRANIDRAISAYRLRHGYQNRRSPMNRPQFRQTHYVTPAVVDKYRAINQANINKANNEKAKFNQSKVAKVAYSKLGDAYVYGAAGKNHFDCSGFTQYIYRHGAHVTLPRTAGAQYRACHHVDYRNAKAGNLLFFGYSPAFISHVGMYLGNGKMIDAQNRGVVIEKVIAPWWHLVGCAQVRA